MEKKKALKNFKHFFEKEGLKVTFFLTSDCTNKAIVIKTVWDWPTHTHTHTQIYR